MEILQTTEDSNFLGGIIISSLLLMSIIRYLLFKNDVLLNTNKINFEYLR